MLAPVLLTCDQGTAPEVLALGVTPESGLVVGVGGTSRFLVQALGRDGTEVASDGAEWASADPSVVTVDGRGVATAVSEGRTELTVRLAGLSAAAEVEVYLPPEVEEYLPGISYFGRNEYVEYVPGRLPVVLSAPHGGRLAPEEMANRSYGVIVGDANTVELTMTARQALVELTGSAPHVVISYLDRGKLDPNREIEEAAQDDPFAERAWEEYHAFIEEARETRPLLRGEHVRSFRGLIAADAGPLEPHVT